MAEPNRLTDWMSSDTAMWAAPLALGFLAGATPGTARAAQGLATGMQMVGQAQEQKRQIARREEMNKRLSGLLGQTQPVNVNKVGVNPETATFETVPEDQPFGDFYSNPAGAPPLPTYQATEQRPVFSDRDRRLGELAIEADRPELAFSLLTREPRQPHTFGSAETGYYAMGPDGQPQQVIPGVGRREPTPPRPVYTQMGGEGVRSVYNPQTGAWEESRQPLTPAPARQLGPEEKEFRAAQTESARSESALRRQRIQNLQNNMAKANDPKATAGQLSSAYNALIRDRDSVETPEEDKPVINDAIRQIRSRLAALGKDPNVQSAPSGQPALPQGKPIGRTKNGKMAYERPNGSRYYIEE